MSSSVSTARVRLLGLSPAAAGTLCCVVSVLGYGAANICMRRLAELGCDPVWAVCNKEFVSVLVVGPWLLVQALRGLPTLPKGRPLVLLLLVGLATEMAGNTGMQWGYGVVGLAVMVPANTAFILTSSAVLGWFLLREAVSRRTMFAMAFLVMSLVLLGAGAGDIGRPLAAGGPADGPVLATLAIAVACVAGVIFALLSITIRHCVTGTTRLSAVVLIITGTGVVSLGPLSVFRLGTDLLGTPPEQFLWMSAAGLCNLVAFVALVRGLQLATVVHVSMLNAGQVALAAVSGIVLFGEPPSPWLLLGVLLTIIGVFTIGRPTAEEAVDQHV
ncbi:MAG: DMT family transporter [Thermoguttaceae bacterium]